MRAIHGALLISALLLSGCSLFNKKTGNEPMELVDFTQTVKITELWSRDLGAGQGDGFTRLMPALSDDLIYTVGSKGQVSAVNRATGKKIWTSKLNDSISAGITSEYDMLLLANTAGELIALASADGAPLWRKQVKGEILSTPQTNGKVVAVQTMNGRIYVVDAKTGEDLWFYENSPPVLILRGTSAPIVTDNAIYAGFSNGRLMAFNPDNGSILWEQRVAIPQGRSELDRMVDINASPLLDGGILYASAFQGKVTAVARGTGSGIWTQDSSSSEAIALANGLLFVSQSDGAVVAYDATTGDLRWKNEQLLRRGLSGPQVFGDYLAVVDYKGQLHVMKQTDGEFVARRKVDSKTVRAPMLTDGEVLYVYGNKGKLMAFRAKVK